MAKTLLQTLLTSPGQLKQGAPAGLVRGQRGGVLVSDSLYGQGIKETDRLQGWWDIFHNVLYYGVALVLLLMGPLETPFGEL